jgi:hypothetical protein
MTVRTSAQPGLVAVAPGDRGAISLTVTNTSPVVDAFRVQVFGLDPSWVTVTPERLSLFPGQTENIDIGVDLPEDYPASHRTISVNVTSDDDPGAFSLNEVALEIRPRTSVALRLDPTMITAGRSARFGMIVSNVGNAVVDATGYAVDPEDLATFTFTPPNVFAAPGRDQVIEVTTTGGRNWFGQPRARTFTFGVDTGDQRVETLGTFIQRPRVARWVLSLLGLLTAAAVFAVVLSMSFDRVVEEASVSDDVLNAALGANEAGGAVVPTNPGSVTGVLTTSSGQYLSGAQAELYVDGDFDTPIGSAATDAKGAFAFSNLGEGTYKLKFTGAGVNVLWYDNTTNPAEATPIEVKLNKTGGKTEPNRLPEITIIGIPVDVTGTIDVDDPTEVAVTLVNPDATGDAEPVVATTKLAPDGSFTLTEVPSPGRYLMVVAAPGSPPQSREVMLEPGAPLADVQVVVPPASGEISGTVRDSSSNAIGGATISASDGSTTIQTVSLTEDPRGSFVLRNLPTPGQYTVTVSNPGFASVTRTVTLTDTQTLDASLVPSTGSISGTALVEGAPARGIRVTVTGGEVNRTVGVISQGGEAGRYSFAGLDAPGTYTLTFSGDGLVTQVQVVDIDPARGDTNASAGPVSLAREGSVVRGIVFNVSGGPVAGATVTLSDGTDNRTVLSADSPLGAFEFGKVAPGAYTVSASLVGTEAVVNLVNVVAGTPTPDQNLHLGAQASLTGTVLSATGGPAPGLPVKLFLPGQFPNGDVLAVAQTDGNGEYTFSGLAAPADYVVAVYAGAASADPLDSVTVRSVPGQPTAVPTFTVQLP